MAQPRKWDHDEGLRLYQEEGWSIVRIARHYGVSDAAVRIVCDPAYRERCRESQWRTRAVMCRGCGERIWKRGRAGTSGLCRRCYGLAQARGVRPDTLCCRRCEEWKPDEEFPRRRDHIARRGRAFLCRPCQTIERRESRNRRRVPCVDCGSPALPPEEKGKSVGPPRCRPCYYASFARVG